MADTKTQPDSKTLTAAAVAKLVKRSVTITDGGASRTKSVPITAAEVLAWHDHGTHVVVVTVDGQKFSSAVQDAAEA